MLPSELADLAIAELRAGQEQKLPSLEVLSNAPAEIGGHNGFALHLRFQTDQGLRMELLMRGFVDQRGFYLLTYRAPCTTSTVTGRYSSRSSVRFGQAEIQFNKVPRRPHLH